MEERDNAAEAFVTAEPTEQAVFACEPSQPSVKVLKNHTSMTEDIVMITMRKQLRLVKGLLIVFIVVIFGLIAQAMVRDALESGDMTDWICAGVFGACGIAFVLWVLIGFGKMTKKNYRKNLNGLTEEVDYEFDPTQLHLKAQYGDGVVTFSHIAYYRIQSVVEYPKIWVFSVIKNQMYTIDKAGMTEGTAEELSTHLRMRVANYIMKKK